MRFDGYYVFGDWLKAENLQPRSFALAKWRLRNCIGFNHQPPEELNPSRRWTLLHMLGLLGHIDFSYFLELLY